MALWLAAVHSHVVRTHRGSRPARLVRVSCLTWEYVTPDGALDECRKPHQGDSDLRARPSEHARDRGSLLISAKAPAPAWRHVEAHQHRSRVDQPRARVRWGTGVVLTRFPTNPQAPFADVVFEVICAEVAHSEDGIVDFIASTFAYGPSMGN
jgi:hypothetical protein